MVANPLPHIKMKNKILKYTQKKDGKRCDLGPLNFKTDLTKSPVKIVFMSSTSEITGTGYVFRN